MAHYQTLSERLTHKYVGTWRHLDAWRDVARVKVLQPKKIHAATRFAIANGLRHARGLDRAIDQLDPSDGPTYVHRVIAPRGWKDKDLMIRALQSEFSAWGCDHEYDCCGCASYSATARHIRGREYRVEIRVSFNY
jgi:hypothetical protein